MDAPLPCAALRCLVTLANCASFTNRASYLHRQCQTVAAVITSKTVGRRFQNLQLSNGSSGPNRLEGSTICPVFNDQCKSLTSRADADGTAAAASLAATRFPRAEIHGTYGS